MPELKAVYGKLGNQMTLLSNAGKVDARTSLVNFIAKLDIPPGAALTERQKHAIARTGRRSALTTSRVYREGAGAFAERAFRDYAPDRIVKKTTHAALMTSVETALSQEIEELTKSFTSGKITQKQFENAIIQSTGDAIFNSSRVMTQSLIEGSATGLKILQEASSCEWCFKMAEYWEDNGSRNLRGFHRNCRCQVVPDLSVVKFDVALIP